MGKNVSVENVKKPTSQALDVAFGGFSDKGVKSENQDAFAAQQPEMSTRKNKGSVVCIADGVSCSDNAKEASQLSVTTFISDYYSTPDSWTVKESVARVLSSLNSWLFHHGKQADYRQNQLVTTFSGVIFKSNTANIFHIGDSRVYLYRDGAIQLLTKDHSQFTSKDNSFLTRALGMDSHLEVDFCQHELQLGDRFVFTTDGVHESLSSVQMKSLLATTTLSLEQIAQDMCLLAKNQGSVDNLSCFIAEIKQLPTQDIHEVSRELTALKIPPVLSKGAKLDDFLIEQVLHSGTRSHVYLAKHLPTDNEFVLKFPTENYSDDLNYLEGFIREQWIGSRINSRGVMKIYPRNEMQSSSPFLYHVCEYAKGKTLRQWMYDNPQPSLTLVREITAEIMAAIRVLQRHSMVHRDLKPENIIINDNNKVKIIDFGTVQVAGLEEIRSPFNNDELVGAVGYIAPEYLLGQKGVHRSDIFSLGIMVYEMLTGELPYKKPFIQKNEVNNLDFWRYRSIQKHRQDIPVWIDLALQKATQPNITHRYQAMSEFLQDIKTPNSQMLSRLDAAPLLERNPMAFWKSLSIALLVVLAVQNIYYFS
nr:MULTISPECIES: bifunctional protein-serine/threonine kinase/phosphatase [unclassified Psychrosphaera]